MFFKFNNQAYAFVHLFDHFQSSEGFSALLEVCLLNPGIDPNLPVLTLEEAISKLPKNETSQLFIGEFDGSKNLLLVLGHSPEPKFLSGWRKLYWLEENPKNLNVYFHPQLPTRATKLMQMLKNPEAPLGDKVVALSVVKKIINKNIGNEFNHLQHDTYWVVDHVLMAFLSVYSGVSPGSSKNTTKGLRLTYWILLASGFDDSDAADFINESNFEITFVYLVFYLHLLNSGLINDAAFKRMFADDIKEVNTIAAKDLPIIKKYKESPEARTRFLSAWHQTPSPFDEWLLALESIGGTNKLLEGDLSVNLNDLSRAAELIYQLKKIAQGNDPEQLVILDNLVMGKKS